MFSRFTVVIIRLLSVVYLIPYVAAFALILSSPGESAAALGFLSKHRTSQELVRQLDSFYPHERTDAAVCLKKKSSGRQQKHSADNEPPLIRLSELKPEITALLVSTGDINLKVKRASVEALNEYRNELSLLLSRWKPETQQEKQVAKEIESLQHSVNTTLNDIHNTLPPQVLSGNAGKLSSLVSFTGYTELETHTGTGSQTHPHTGARFTMAKTEAHVKLAATAGSDAIYLKTTLHGYAYPDNESISDPWYDNRIVATELFGAVVRDNFDIQAGIQTIKWGTADTLNPTSWFNPYDLTESLLKDDDELFRGVPMISGTLAFGNSTLQTVIAPVHTPAELPGKGAPWELVYPPVTINTDLTGNTDITLPVIVTPDPDTLETSIKNTGIGLRVATTTSAADLSLTLYHGPDRDVILKPELIYNQQTPEESFVAMVPQYEIITAVGGDIAFDLSGITFQTEVTWTADKPAVSTGTGPALSILETAGYLYWTTGATWISDTDLTLIIEYLDGMFTDSDPSYLDPFFTDLLSGTLRKPFFDDSLILEIQGLFSTSNHDSLIMPTVEWNFQNGLIMSICGGIFSGTPDTLFGSYDSRDVVNCRVRYYF